MNIPTVPYNIRISPNFQRKEVDRQKLCVILIFFYLLIDYTLTIINENNANLNF